MSDSERDAGSTRATKLDRVFHLLSLQLRREILTHLAREPLTTGELVNALKRRNPNIKKQVVNTYLNQLEKAELIPAWTRRNSEKHPVNRKKLLPAIRELARMRTRSKEQRQTLKLLHDVTNRRIVRKLCKKTIRTSDLASELGVGEEVIEKAIDALENRNLVKKKGGPAQRWCIQGETFAELLLTLL